MKIQCSCGAKFEFEITPAMAAAPVQFMCPACGQDASPFVDSLVRRELGQTASPSGTPIALGRAQGAGAEPAGAQPRLALRKETPPSGPAEPSSANEAAPNPCPKHPGQFAAEQCSVCGKPICPRCMELFGYVCSPLCKAKAEARGMPVPVYSGQTSVREARVWRRTVWIASVLGGAAALVLGFWFWYSWFGSVPKAIFSVRFPETALAGQSAFGGQNLDQVVLFHGATLARYSINPQKEIWSVRLLDRERYSRIAEAQLKAMQERNVHLTDQGVEDLPKIPPADKLIDQLEGSAEDAMTLYVRGENVWVASPGKVVRYDWETGKPAKEFQVPPGAGAIRSRGDDLIFLNASPAPPGMTDLNLNTCDLRTEDFGQGATLNGPALAGGTADNSQLAGLPLGMPGRDMGKAMDPSKVEEQAQHLSTAQRLALPATLANSMNQERELAVMDDRAKPQNPSAQETTARGSTSLVPTRDGFIEFAVRVLESRIVERSAVKAGTGKPALSDGLTAGGSMDAANGILNEMQHERGGDLVQVDESRYQVTLRRPGSAGGWTGEVIGAPRLFPLESATVLTAGKTLMVFDKTNKLLWKSSLSFELPNIPEATDPQSARFGEGPCVERQGALYVFDQGFLACFDLANGNRRWGLPTVGVAGLLFDDHNMVYVNTTSASPEKLRYSRQIDLSQKINPVVLKVDSTTGRVLWRTEQAGLVSYVSGKLVLSTESYQPSPEEQDGPDTGLETLPYLRIRRLDAHNGRELWQYFQQRAPLDIAFEGNRIRLVFRKEVQVLRFMVL